MRNVYRIRLNVFEIRVLIHVLADYRNDLIAAGKDTTDISNLLLKVLNVYDPA